jgi:hypothetical protein
MLSLNKKSCYAQKKCNGHPLVSGICLLNGTTTQRATTQTIQSDAQQELTAPVETALFQTPTMSFGEVGITKQTSMPGYDAKAHGVGHFEQTQVLERMRLVNTFNWTTTSTALLFSNNLMYFLKNFASNAVILDQFNMFRAGIEVTVRLNTNPLYYGAMMVTLYPSNSVANRIDENAVIDPTIISASCGESVIKQWTYNYPDGWLDASKIGSVSEYGSVWCEVHQLAPLTATNSTAPNNIEVQVWARFTDVQLAFPTSTDSFDEVQSGVSVKILKKKGTFHPIDDAQDSVKEVVTALKSVTIGDIASEAIDLARDLFPPIGYILDKPDKTSSQQAIISEPSIDLFTTDIEDTNVGFGMYKDRYVDPQQGRLPSSKNFTVSDYARIPGLRQTVMTFAPGASAIEVYPIQTHPDNSSLAIPLDYCYLSSVQWRGSVKVCLQFFTSAFISARFSVRYINSVEYTDGYAGAYDTGLTRIINVKGDTVDTFTLPWLSKYWWSESALPAFQLNLISTIATTDTVNSPKIYVICWIAGGEDIQFAFPTIVNPDDWSSAAPGKNRGPVKTKSKLKPLTEGDEVQSQISATFQQTFPPIGENTMYDIDNGLCTSESLGPITDIMKRYSNIQYNPGFSPPGTVCVDGNDVDYCPGEVAVPPGTAQYSQYYAMRLTLWGMWRACFWAMSGGLRFRYYDSVAERTFWYPTLGNSSSPIISSLYVSPPDNVTRLTVPMLMNVPFGVLSQGVDYQRMGVAPSPAITPSVLSIAYLAARDDVQLGFPILPCRIVPPANALSKSAPSEKNSGRRSLTTTKGKYV